MAQNCGADNFKQRKAVRHGLANSMWWPFSFEMPGSLNMLCFTWGLYPQVPVSPSSLKMPIRTPTKTDFCLISSERKGWKPQKWGQTGTMPRHSNCSLGRFQQNSMTGACFFFVAELPGSNVRSWRGLKTETCYVLVTWLGMVGIWRHVTLAESLGTKEP